MGCDIHLYVEIWDKYAKRWISADKWTEYILDDGSDTLYVEYNDMFYKGRNYSLFSLLADVRNETDERYIVPIDQPRGLPDDVSRLVEEVSDRFGEDGHSHSYFTLAELHNVDWDRRIKDGGLVTVKEYEVYKKNGFPDSWCESAYGQTISIIDNDEMDRRIKTKKLQGRTYYTKVSWTKTLAEQCEAFYSDVIPRLEKLVPQNIPLNEAEKLVRIVFWFDN